jgi:hypothetical protein
MTDAELHQKLVKVSADPKKMAGLNKSEREAMLDFFATKKRNSQVLKIVSQ